MASTVSGPLTEGLFGTQNHYDPYFNFSPITRLSFLRSDNSLLHKASTSPEAKYLCMQDLNPLRKNGQLHFLSYDQVQPIVGEPYAQDEKTQTQKFDSSRRPPTLVFLGLNLEANADPAPELREFKGEPYFALDVTGQPAEQIDALARDNGAEFTPTRVDLTLSYAASSVYAQARSFLDWNARNRFCSSCGGATQSISGGAKVMCPPTDGGTKRGNCPTRVGLHNTSFPRTDPTLIAAPVSADGKRVLLGRGKRWPPNYWSCLSGFVEPAESMESAMRREVFEESGVKVGPVQLHSSQAFPYPSTLLVGTIGQCEAEVDEKITYPEQELEEARWFEFAEVKEGLDHGHAMWEEPPAGYKGIRLPGDKLMAHRTLRGVLRLFGRIL